MTNTQLSPPTDRPVAAPAAAAPDPPPRHQVGRSRTWARRALAVILLVVAVGAWFLAQVYQVLLVAPLVVTAGTVIHRGFAARSGHLTSSLATNPLAPTNRAALAQFALRALLAVLVLLAADIALLDIEAGGLPSPTTQWILVAAPLALFVTMQLIPGPVVSRSLNAVALVVAAFLAFQLVQVHARSGAGEAIAIRAPFEGEWHVPSAGRNSGFSAEPHLHMQVQDTPDSNNQHHTGDGDSYPFRFTGSTHIRNGDEHDEQTSLFRRNDRIRTNELEDQS